VTGSPHLRSRARRRRRAVWRLGLGAVVLAALVAALPALWLVPASPGAIRVGGISIEWWYGGLLAPVAGWVVAVWALRGERDAPDGLDGGFATPADAVPDPVDPDRAAVASMPSEPA
jgi:hypothetical protein